ncbi:hypothetical protein ORV05_17645 [Amycolatopsis cynarae]|uniref:Uncharacterized protein n=1 Tax=Amycolatopsis cynarae TaxID=2995223 RepID=A0ABY7BBM4_9PSEU|nr:hypothetical protein [Amycolatopsis sp. HUAS 11-8]WAL69516.1 hypothetical protein ORV05_17645 [Amycolatopsis sp. HUAS 11-8]
MPCLDPSPGMGHGQVEQRLGQQVGGKFPRDADPQRGRTLPVRADIEP